MHRILGTVGTVEIENSMKEANSRIGEDRRNFYNMRITKVSARELIDIYSRRLWKGERNK